MISLTYVSIGHVFLHTLVHGEESGPEALHEEHSLLSG